MIDLYEGVLTEFAERVDHAYAIERWRLDVGHVYTPDDNDRYAGTKRQSEKRLRLARLAKGLCPDCPAGLEHELARGITRCEVCAAKQREYSRRSRAKTAVKTSCG